VLGVSNLILGESNCTKQEIDVVYLEHLVQKPLFFLRLLSQSNLFLKSHSCFDTFRLGRRNSFWSFNCLSISIEAVLFPLDVPILWVESEL